MKSRSVCLIIAVALMAAMSGMTATPAIAANPSSASGKVVDQEGNPIQGALVKFVPVDGTFEWKAKTNKKGKYFIDGLINSNNDKWTVTVEKEGLVATHFRLESRTVNRVLLGDPMDRALSPGQSIPDMVIKPLGAATVDFTLGSEEEARKAVAASQKDAEKLIVVDEKGNKQEVKQKDPWDEALELASSGSLDESVGSFDRAVKAEPEDPERREVFAKILYQLERLDEAEVQALKAVELAPQGIDSRMVLYSIAVARQDMDRARSVLGDAQKIAPNDVRVLEQQAYVAQQTGQTDDAILAYEAITELAPENTGAWVSLGGLYAGKGENAKSSAAYQRVVDLDPKDAHSVFFNLGALVMNDRNRTEADTKRAVVAFRKAIEHKPDYAQAHKQLAFALLGMGDRKGARESLEAYVRSAPTASDAPQMKQMIKSLQ